MLHFFINDVNKRYKIVILENIDRILKIFVEKVIRISAYFIIKPGFILSFL